METKGQSSKIIIIIELLENVTLGFLKWNPRITDLSSRHGLFWKETELFHSRGCWNAHSTGRWIPKRRDRKGRPKRDILPNKGKSEMESKYCFTVNPISPISLPF